MVINSNGFDTHTYKSYEKHKKYKQKLEEQNKNRPINNNMYIEQKYFNCLACGKVNIVQDIIGEKTENRTYRTKYLTWKKFKDISNEKGGSLENGLNYLISLHEDRASNSGRDNYEIGIAGFGGDLEKKKR